MQLKNLLFSSVAGLLLYIILKVSQSRVAFAVPLTACWVHFDLTVELLCFAGMVEVWLQKLVDGMQGTVKSTIKRAYRNVQEMALEDFIFGHPAQIALLGIQFQWTADTQVICIMCGTT